MEMKKLDFAETLKDSIAIGVKNAPSVVVAVALWLVTTRSEFSTANTAATWASTSSRPA
mgnify:CR=1 FL=1